MHDSAMAPTLTATQKTVLAMSKSEYLGLVQPTHPADRLRVGAAIFRMDVRSSRPTILLLRRHVPHMTPLWAEGTFELPSGKVDDADWSMSDALARAVARQTGLKVTRVLGMLSEQRATAEHVWLDERTMQETARAYESVQLNWTVLVESSDQVAVSPEYNNTKDGGLGGEDVEFVWASWNALDMLSLTAETCQLAREALEWAGRCLS